MSANEEPLVPIPMAVLVDEGDIRGASSRAAECTVNYCFVDYSSWPFKKIVLQFLGDFIQVECEDSSGTGILNCADMVVDIVDLF